MDHRNRRQRRAVSRDEARRTRRLNPTPGKNRAERRALRYRPSAEITYHRSQARAARRRAPGQGPAAGVGQGRAVPLPGQKRINHKRSVRDREFLDWAVRQLTQLDQKATREAA